MCYFHLFRKAFIYFYSIGFCLTTSKLYMLNNFMQIFVFPFVEWLQPLWSVIIFFFVSVHLFLRSHFLCLLLCIENPCLFSRLKFHYFAVFRFFSYAFISRDDNFVLAFVFFFIFIFLLFYFQCEFSYRVYVR